MTTFVNAGTIIVTSFVYPPIPIRSSDWSAHFDDYDGAPDAGHQSTGSGETEFLAVLDMYDDIDGWYDVIICAHRPMFAEDLTDDNDDLVDALRVQYPVIPSFIFSRMRAMEKEDLGLDDLNMTMYNYVAITQGIIWPEAYREIMS